MPEWQPPGRAPGAPWPDRAPAGHAPLSLSPAVRAAAPVAAAVTLLVAGLVPALPLDPARTRAGGGIQHEDTRRPTRSSRGRERCASPSTSRSRTPRPTHRDSSASFRPSTWPCMTGHAGVRAEDPRGRRLRTTLQERNGVNVASVQPRPPVRYRNVRRFTLSYTLPDGASSDVRIRPSVVIVPIWSFGTQGSVRVRLPSDYEVLVDGDALRAEQDGSAWQLDSGTVPDPSRWLARITATLPSSYVTAERQVPLARATSTCRFARGPMTRPGAAARSRLLTDALPRPGRSDRASVPAHRAAGDRRVAARIRRRAA